MKPNQPAAASALPNDLAAAMLGDLATTWAGASRVFQRHGLDFCCHGHQTLAAACAKKGLAAEVVAAELRAELGPAPAATRWGERPTEELVQHLLDHYHDGHRRELPRLVRMATKVEAVHGDKPDCPRGLCAQLQRIGEELEAHMAKEEQILFPMLLAGEGGLATGPIGVMEREHDQHGHNLALLRQLAHDFEAPPTACGTWRALYLGLADFERDVMQHIALENHELFPRAIRG